MTGRVTAGLPQWQVDVLARRDVWGRAPSAHNTQPWVVTGSADGLVLGWDEARHLAVGDPSRRDLLLSLGAVAESLVITAASLGHRVEPRWSVDLASRRAATLELAQDGGSTPSAWSPDDLVARRTARSAYAGPFVGPDEVETISERAGLRVAEPAAALEVLPPGAVDELLPVADRHTLDGPATAELRDWLRLDRRDPRYREDGLSDVALGLARPMALGLRVALLPPVLALLRRTRLTRLLAATSTARPLGTVVVLTAPADLPAERLGELGRGLLRLWLAASAAGLSCHPLSQLLDCPETERRLPIGEGRQAYAVFRIGRPTAPPPASARLP